MTTYRPNAVCPRCHRPPAVRYYEATVEWARTLEPDEPIENVICQSHGCGEGYVIAAVCLQTGREDTSRKKALAVAKQAA